MSQANVYYTLSNATVFTDRLEVSCDDTFTYQVYMVELVGAFPGNGVPVIAQAAQGNLYSQPRAFSAGTYQLYAGAGNKVTLVTASANISATELGTASSATAGVIGTGS
jgi:hypothetical protein